METTLRSSSKVSSGAKIRTYSEIIDYLDSHWNCAQDKTLQRMVALDTALGKPSQAMPVILVAGTNGKSLTISFASQLLTAEGIRVGTMTSPHLLTYHERFAVNNEHIGHKAFTDIAQEVIETAEQAGIQAHTSELLAAMAFLYCKQQNVEVAILEAAQAGAYDPVNIATARICTITRVTGANPNITAQELKALTQEAMGIVKAGTYIVSGDQNKATLNYMQELTQAQGGHWMMPIRKVADLAYPFEQLHGRCAALAERLCQTLVDVVLQRQGMKDGLLTRQKIQRGRPTTEAKRLQDLNPRKTIEQFWKEVTGTVPGSFELLEKEKPSILLDTAHNLDAIENLLLGIRLKHYQRPLKGLTLVIGAAAGTLASEQFMKMLRYFFKKTSGQVLLCPISKSLPGIQEDQSWDAEAVAEQMRDLKIKVRACTNFEDAFAQACKSVDEKHGLVVITGSRSIVQEYWTHKDMKKLNGL